MKLQIPLKYSDPFASLHNNWGESVGAVRLEEYGNMDDDYQRKKVLLESWWCSIWQRQGSTNGLTGAFSEQCVQLIARLLLMTSAYKKLVHFQ
jgi:hypothetical protein